MATYRILAWRDIPTQIRATDGDGGRADRKMPKWFMQEISRITMREGLTSTDDYVEQFAWSEKQVRPGTADEVADAVYAELCAKFGRSLEGRRLERRSDREAAAAAKAAEADGAGGADEADGADGESR